MIKADMRGGSNTRARVLAKARGIIPTSLHDIYMPRIGRGEWPLDAVASENRVKLLKALWPIIPKPERPSVLGTAISDGDALFPHLVFLLRAIRAVRAGGARVCKGPDDEVAFEALPDAVTVFRGTVEAEFEEGFFGISWTRSKDRAIWFATEHGRFRNRNSPPVVLSMEVTRDDVAGVLVGRQEEEVVVDTAVSLRAKHAGRMTMAKAPH